MNDYIVSVNNNKYEISIDGNNVEVDGEIFNIDLAQLSKHLHLLSIENNVYQITSQKQNENSYSVTIEGYSYDATVRTKLEEQANEYLMNKAKESGTQIIKSPMPGLIVKVLKNVGDSVEMGEAIILLEAMKMENEIRATSAGVIKEINIKENQSVEKNTSLIVIA